MHCLITAAFALLGVLPSVGHADVTPRGAGVWHPHIPPTAGRAASLFPQDGASTSPVAEPSGPQKWALLIGINDYAEISDLKYCRRDMELLRERLVTAGFPQEHIVLLHDRAKRSVHQPFKTSIEHHLDHLLAKVGSDDLVVLAFSGHGVDLDGHSYLCPIEARLADPEKTLV